MERAHQLFLGFALGLTAAWLALPAAPAIAKAPMVASQAPGFYRMSLGGIEITALLDGTHTFPVAAVMQAPPEAPGPVRRLLTQARPGEVEARLAAEALEMPLEGSINAFLINTGDRLVLIDSGAGDLYGVCCGKLRANMEAAGYRPEDVDDVLLTHLHADHVGGLMRDGKPVFPTATIHVSRTDEDYWLNPDNETAAPAFLHPMFEGARQVLKPYLDAGRVKPFDYGPEVLPGITPMATPGHTPGHSSYAVRAGDETFIVWGDIVHVAPIQFPDPAITVTYDNNGDLAEAQRGKLFAHTARHMIWVGAAHISFPGIGHIALRDGKFGWLPTNYTTEFAAQAPGGR
ncbi:beta-lactamase [Skermanella stibiiresistens SB22]|uniref:Beta-lactamase n=1 Tax=Skermanella stibiiresistens SB22 TaxID=1385369 RepID=W9HCE9_9PROT|nr:MBL fold metallo-hydrolase [Skermanella stibiiresistens]EWY42406.1 beta-lactamase [Skermanella stibiiresistens SB22]